MRENSSLPAIVKTKWSSVDGSSVDRLSELLGGHDET